MKLVYEMYKAGSIFSGHSGAPAIVETKKALLVLYPRDFTPICTEEIQELNDMQSKFPEGWFVAGVSTDSPEVHQEAWGRVADFTLPLLTMTTESVREDTRFFINGGYASRVCLWLMNDEIQQIYMTHNSVKRDLKHILDMTTKLDSVIK